MKVNWDNMYGVFPTAPLIGGELAQTFGFAWLMRIVGILNIIYGPILIYLYQKYDPKVRLLGLKQGSFYLPYAFRFCIIQSLREHHNDLLMQSSGRGSRYKQLYNSMDRE